MELFENHEDNFSKKRNKKFHMGDAAGMEGSSLAKIFVGGLDRSVDEVGLREY